MNIILIRVIKPLLKLLLILLSIFLVSNLGFAFDALAHDRVKVTLLPGATGAEVVERNQGTRLISEEPDVIIGFPEEKESEYISLLQNDKQVDLTFRVYTLPRLNVDQYLVALKHCAEMYTSGTFGEISFRNGFVFKTVPITEHLSEMAFRSFSYLIPGLLVGVTSGIALALLAVWKPRIGRVLDISNRLLLSVPDFLMIVLIQYAAIAIDRRMNSTVIVVMQYQDQIPFLIPMLGISVLPGALIYGALRIAFEREWREGYIKTAYSKGLSRSLVISRHMFRNTVEDLLTILPRAVSVAIASMVVAEVMTMIFGIGGYPFAQSVTAVSSLATTCAILAIFTLLTNGLISYLRNRQVVQKRRGS
ncbi:ABC transporter permease subunit [Tumebacillus lipolyticus]|uniref:ABC transporter permease subunit n=1 Tax=Tumebacillus lipolyticus TaxID=1280370 RepID=A0ABW4ZYD7_9BACL